MSSISDVEIDLDKLFLPAWAQEPPPANRYEKYSGEEGVRPGRKREGRRGPPRGEPFGERRGPRPPRAGKASGDRPKRFGRRDDRRERERREPPPPLPELAVTILPDEKGVESLARQIKMTGRAYPLFQIAQLILQKPERYAVRLTVRKRSDGTVVQPLFVCALDETPWVSEDEAVAHVLKHHFATFYQAERTATEPPKGTYTFVAQCGMSGVILGPPNYHGYQNQLRKLHAERFAKMPFEVFKSRVKIVKDEAVVKKWIEEQSFKTEYVCLNVPEPLKLGSFEEVEKHFRGVHKDTIIKPVESHTVNGVQSRTLRSRDLQRLVRQEWEQQRYFPLPLATGLSRQFATYGLQFFKVNRTVTHVSVARPLFLDLETTPVSEGVKRLIAEINAHPRCSRRQLIEALAPSPKPPTNPGPGEVAGKEAPAAAEAGAPRPEPAAEQTAVIADLHWLVHQGHVIEFADGRLETARKPAPKPPKSEPKSSAETAAAGEQTAPAVEAVAPPETAVPAAEPAPTAPPPPPVEAGTTAGNDAPGETVVHTDSKPVEPGVPGEVATDAPAAPPTSEAGPAAEPPMEEGGSIGAASRDSSQSPS